MRKRNRSYRPRLQRIPVSAGLLAEFREAAVRCEIALRLRVPGSAAFDELAGIYNVAGPLIIERLPDGHDDALTLNEASLAMNAAAERRDGESVGMTDSELLCLQRGLQVVLERLGTLDVSRMYEQIVRLRRMDATSKETSNV